MFCAMALLATGSISFVPVAQSAESVPPQILACANERDVMVRLACYDREVAALVALPPEAATHSSPPVRQSVPAVAVTDAPAPAPVRAPDPAPAPGARVAPAPEPQPKDQAGFGFDPRAENISATVTKIRKRPYGELRIWLDNGQVWEQDHLDRRFKLRVGEIITVKKGAFSGYRLSGNGNRSIQVTRRK